MHDYAYMSLCEHAVYKPTSYSALLIITCTRQITSSMFKINIQLDTVAVRKRTQDNSCKDIRRKFFIVRVVRL